jgi:glycosyltransferase involved in cell wall biosynthesis
MGADDRRRVWIVAETYYPERTSTGYFMTGIAEGLAAHDDVRVVCSQPTYARRGVRAPRRETRNGVGIRRVRSTTFDKNRLPLRFINLVTITCALAWVLLTSLSRGDIVMVVTNPPTLPFLVRLVAWWRRARFVLIVHDVYPDAAIAAGLIRREALSARVMIAASSWLYGSSDAISVCGRDMAALVSGRLRRARPVHVITNWATADVLALDPDASSAMRRSLGLDRKVVVQYAGNMGAPHDIEGLIEVMATLSVDTPDVHFLFIGSGRKRGMLEQAMVAQGLANVTLLDEQPREAQRDFLPACDVAVMAFVPGMRGVGVPSRLYNIMASGRPVIAGVDADSEPGQVIREDAIGWVVPPHDARAMTAAILEARGQVETRRAMGRRARAAAIAKYQDTHAIEAYRRLLAGVVADRENRAGEAA